MPYPRPRAKRIHSNFVANFGDALLDLWRGPLGPDASDSERRIAAIHDVSTAMGMTNPANAISDLLENYICTYSDLAADPKALDGLNDRRADLLALMAALRERATPLSYDDIM